MTTHEATVETKIVYRGRTHTRTPPMSGIEDVTLAVGLARFPFNCGRCGAPVEHLQVCADTSDGRGICGDCIDDYVSGKDLND